MSERSERISQLSASVPHAGPQRRGPGMSLERRYRALLAWYPPEHRREYREELLGVLLDDAPAGRRWPGVRDVAALLNGALRARVRYSLRAAADVRWRDAAAAVGLLAVLVLLGYALRPLLLGYTIVATSHAPAGGWQWSLAEGLLDWHSWPRAAAWLGVTILVVAGRRRPAALAAWAAAGLEAARLAVEYDRIAGPAILNIWPLALALLGAAALTVPGPRPGAAVLGRGRLAAFTTAVALWAAASAIAVTQGPDTPAGEFIPVLLRTDVGRFEALLNLTAFGLAAACLASTAAPLRRRLLALLAPVAITLLLTRLHPVSWMTPPGYDDGLPAAGWLTLTAATVLTLPVAAAIIRRQERTDHPTTPPRTGPA
jgi:hypothetical protein